MHRQSHRGRRDHAEEEERNLPVCPALHSLQSTFCSSADSLSICLSLLTHTHITILWFKIVRDSCTKGLSVVGRFLCHVYLVTTWGSSCVALYTITGNTSSIKYCCCTVCMCRITLFLTLYSLLTCLTQEGMPMAFNIAFVLFACAGLYLQSCEHCSHAVPFLTLRSRGQSVQLSSV